MRGVCVKRSSSRASFLRSGELLLHSILRPGISVESVSRGLENSDLPEEWFEEYCDIVEVLGEDPNFLYDIKIPKSGQRTLPSIETIRCLMKGIGSSNLKGPSIKHEISTLISRLVNSHVNNVELKGDERECLMIRLMKLMEDSGILYEDDTHSALKAGSAAGNAAGSGAHSTSRQKKPVKSRRSIREEIKSRPPRIEPFSSETTKKVFEYLDLPSQGLSYPYFTLMMMNPLPTVWTVKSFIRYASGIDVSTSGKGKSSSALFHKLAFCDPKSLVLIADGLMYHPTCGVSGGWHLIQLQDDLLSNPELCARAHAIGTTYGVPPNALLYAHTKMLAPSLNLLPTFGSDRGLFYELWLSSMAERCAHHLEMSIASYRAEAIKKFCDSLKEAKLKFREKIKNREQVSLQDLLQVCTFNFADDLICTVLNHLIESKRVISIFPDDAAGESIRTRLRSTLLDQLNRSKVAFKTEESEIIKICEDVLSNYTSADNHQVLFIFQFACNDVAGKGRTLENMPDFNLGEKKIDEIIKLLDAFPEQRYSQLTKLSKAVLENSEAAIEARRAELNRLAATQQAHSSKEESRTVAGVRRKKMPMKKKSPEKETTCEDLDKCIGGAVYPFVVVGSNIKRLIHSVLE